MNPSEKKIFNILHVVSRLPVGGVENMLLKVVRRYDRERFNVTVCCIKEGGEVADELVKAGFIVEVLGRMKGHGFDPGAVRALYKLIKKKDIHILRTHQYHSNLYGRLAGIFAGVPVIIPSFHNLYVSPNKPKLHRRIINCLLSFFSDSLVAVSNTIVSDITGYDGVSRSKIKVIYNGIEEARFSQSTSKKEARGIFGLPDGLTLIGSVGRLTRQKGHSSMIKAASGIPDVCVVIAGEGPLADELKKTAESLNVRCVLLGRLKYEDVPDFLRALDIFCFPSLWEGMPSALAEAMAAELPIVASDIPPHKEVLGDTGVLIDPHDTSMLGSELKRLISDPSLRNSLAERAKERSHIFSINNTVKAYQDLFESMLKKKSIS